MPNSYLPNKQFSTKSNINKFEDYQKLYIESINTPVEFWTKQAESNLKWIKKWDSVYKQDFKGIGTKEEPYVEYFKGGTLNVSENCIDRHLETSANKTAIIWQGEDSSQYRTLTYQDLYLGVCKLANSLLKLGIKKGDAITIYMPMVPEAIMAMLACSRIGAIHSVVFSAFSSESLKNRINDCSSKIVITSDVSYYGGKTLDILSNVEKIIDDCPTIENVIVYNRASNPPSRESSPRKETKFINDKFHWWHELVQNSDIKCLPTEMSAEDPLFILYTSGSTGKPKGVLHTTAGYLLYANLTFKYVFDYKETDIFWCTADIGWITGHSYLVYGPLSNGATCMMYEGTPTFPTPTRFWEIIDKHKVTVFYTAPTAIRSLMKFGEKILEDYSLKSLRLLGTVGEPINPESWEWYYKFIGKERCPIVDTWWQTETGGIMITTLPGAMSMKPGSAGLPFFGIVP